MYSMMMFDKVVLCSQAPPTASKEKGLVKSYTSTCAMKLHIHIHVNTCILGLGDKFCNYCSKTIFCHCDDIGRQQYNYCVIIA